MPQKKKKKSHKAGPALYLTNTINPNQPIETTQPNPNSTQPTQYPNLTPNPLKTPIFLFSPPCSAQRKQKLAIRPQIKSPSNFSTTKLISKEDNRPVMITAQECKQIRESLTFTSGNGQKHKLKIGKNFVSTTELGDISISKSTKLSKVNINQILPAGNNVYCNGQTIRTDAGKMLTEQIMVTKP